MFYVLPKREEEWEECIFFLVENDNPETQQTDGVDGLIEQKAINNTSWRSNRYLREYSWNNDIWNVIKRECNKFNPEKNYLKKLKQTQEIPEEDSLAGHWNKSGS